MTHLQADPLILERSTTTFAALAARLRGDLAISGGADRLVVVPRVDLPPVEVDVGRVGQILGNLVGNALKYAPDGSPVVLDATADATWLTVTVDDEGVGVPEEDRSLVTEPFHRAWNVRESPFRARASACSSAGVSSRPTAAGYGSTIGPTAGPGHE